MEEGDYNCPVCQHVFKAEIYQCTAGHVICHICYGKVATCPESSACPECREKYSKPGIRNRRLEKVLDKVEFECEFKDDGCNYKCKRSALSNHENSCGFSPDLFPVCELMGWEGCKFVLSTSSKRADIITHFQETHQVPIEFKGELNLMLESIVTGIRDEMAKKHGDVCFANFISPAKEESSPLFLVIGKINCSTKFVSFMCIQVWGCKASTKYQVDFSLHRNHPLLVNWSLNVYSLKDVEHTLKTCPINIPIRVLEEGLYGKNTKGKLCITVSQIYN